MERLDFGEATLLSCDMFDKFLVLLWSIWLNSNDLLWNNKAMTHDQLVISSMAWYEEFTLANSQPSKSLKPAKKKNLPWKPPEGQTLKLNVDGAYLPASTRSGVGGVLRNYIGLFLAGFAYRMEHTSSPLHAELEAVRCGIDLLQAMEVKDAIVESSSYCYQLH